ncbi:NADH:ubiquinone oxidoreductase subunit V3 [Nomia melanderi]|uniref:NADH:ubiquinone oxidoreductase subunit V3 n=1 Tax=Nomia melanderi TaxID=2448451 RepID=UPI00130441D8|nr:uncharacterized protein LOC116425778 [Nomia melanderi]
MLRPISSKIFSENGNLLLLRSFSAKAKKQSTISGNVTGLSDKCVKVPSAPVGPNAAKDKEYKNPEYFCYHTDSFGEAEVELAKFRLPAPSNKVPFQQ